MIILVCGDRNWSDKEFLFKALDKERESWASELSWKALIEGDAFGADKMAGMWAASRGIQPIICPALWSYYGKRAGPIRNSIQAFLKPDFCYAFHADIENSKGTKHMISLIEPERVKIYTGREDLGA